MQCEQVGIFCRNHDHKEFLTSEIAAEAGHHIQYAFEREHDLQACRAIVQNYSRGGMDNGVTREVMRKACGLSCKEKDRDEDAKDPAHVLGSQGNATGPADLVTTRCASDALDIAVLTNQKGWNGLTRIMLNQINTPSCVTKTIFWEELLTKKLWRPIPSKNKVGEIHVPFIHTKNSYASLFCP